MLIGVPKEIKVAENRVGMVPAGVQTLVDQGHDVMIETKAGLGAGIPDEAYEAVGARIVSDAETAWDAEMVIKVKEPVQPEWHRMKSPNPVHIPASRSGRSVDRRTHEKGCSIHRL